MMTSIFSDLSIQYVRQYLYDIREGGKPYELWIHITVRTAFRKDIHRSSWQIN